jgi:hypothetical protein
VAVEVHNSFSAWDLLDMASWPAGVPRAWMWSDTTSHHPTARIEQWRLRFRYARDAGRRALLKRRTGIMPRSPYERPRIATSVWVVYRDRHGKYHEPPTLCYSWPAAAILCTSSEYHDAPLAHLSILHGFATDWEAFAYSVAAWYDAYVWEGQRPHYLR